MNRTIRLLLKKYVPSPLLRMGRSVRNSIRTATTLFIAQRLIMELEAMPESPFKRTPRAGHLRGIDFYDRSQLTRAIALSMANYKATHGTLPNLLEPRRFNEKIVWSKFFREFRVPASGNKLLTSEFIPSGLKDAISCPRVIWHSPIAKLPSNDEIAPGDYYFKANHGSGMVIMVSFPLSGKELAGLEAKSQEWLSNNYGLEWGEWWYNSFQKELLIEEAVTCEKNAIFLMFHVFDGDVAFITLYRKILSFEPAPEESIWLDADFNSLQYQNESVGIIRNIPYSEELMLKLKHLASKIGKQFQYARVDFIVDNSERAFLGEVTFTPNDGRMPWPTKMDLSLGDKWNLQ